MAKKGMGIVTKAALGVGVVSLGVYAVWKLFLSKPEPKQDIPAGDTGLTQKEGGSEGYKPEESGMPVASYVAPKGPEVSANYVPPLYAE